MNGSQIRDADHVEQDRWTAAACDASRGLPMAASAAVTHVPMFAPNASVMPASRVIKPCEASTMTMPVVAAELWTSAVNACGNEDPEQRVVHLLHHVWMNGS